MQDSEAGYREGRKGKGNLNHDGQQQPGRHFTPRLAINAITTSIMADGGMMNWPTTWCMSKPAKSVFSVMGR
ncbi:hypothetical protein [Pseudarthrobacter albicanus]|uniref:hypothetical protein n=1 Tax=Pseudarthrobacter albicanus TaxID=2823873 RepID=UPI001BAB0296|nr:hypothetical protein [Pseudarthrobacter albicanus]